MLKHKIKPEEVIRPCLRRQSSRPPIGRLVAWFLAPACQSIHEQYTEYPNYSRWLFHWCIRAYGYRSWLAGGTLLVASVTGVWMCVCVCERVNAEHLTSGLMSDSAAFMFIFVKVNRVQDLERKKIAWIMILYIISPVLLYSFKSVVIFNCP